MSRSATIRNGTLVRLCFAVSLALLVDVSLPATLPSTAYAYEVWITDQSDTAKESGGFLYI